MSSAVAPDPAPIVAEIAKAGSRRRRRFRVIFAATWAILIGGLILVLAVAGAIDLRFLQEGPPWWRFILGEVEIVTEGPAGIAIGPLRFIITGAFATTVISVVAMLLATGLALLGSLGRVSKSAPVYAIATLYVSLVRGTPLLVQILFIWLALPQIWQGFGTVHALIMGTFALGFNYGAYMTEIFRAGIQAVPQGQREAAAALGMSEVRIFRRIVLPQAFRIVTPAIGNEFIAMIKDTSLLSILSVRDVTQRMREFQASSFLPFSPFNTAAIVYVVITLACASFLKWLERRYDAR